jgi:Na+:H+ antiporter, NhaA family
MARSGRWLRRPRAALARFLETEASGGVFLLAATLIALAWANVGGYESFWGTEIDGGPLPSDLRHWVNDGLMTIFFLVVGLEIKRELVVGELRDPRVAVLPVAAAFGGMAGPALIYLVINAGEASVAGWGIPMATDIAFVVGALALLGKRAPSGLKLFVLTLAIVDDIGAIVVIAIFYSHGLEVRWLALTALILGTFLLLRRTSMASPWIYLVPGIALWFCTLRSGIHPTIAGVALGLMVPAGAVGGRSVLEDLEARLHPVSSYVVVPVFALANAGVALSADAWGVALDSPVFWGIAAGLIGGKLLGIFGTAWLTERTGLGRRSSDVHLRHIAGGAAVSGIGFTVSLFIAGLAFDSAALVDRAKLGVLAGSAASALIGGLILAVPLRSVSGNRRSAS